MATVHFERKITTRFPGRKYCDVCERQVTVLGSRKLKDGNLCMDCAKKLSPFFDDRKNPTIAQIKAQMIYRKANRQKVSEFNPTKVIGRKSVICIDEHTKTWLFSRTKSWISSNPDIISLSQVTGCNVDIEEKEQDFLGANEQGDHESTPYEYKKNYDFNITIYVNSPWFEDIKFKLNGCEIDSCTSEEYAQTEREAQEIQSILTGEVKVNV